MLHWTLKKMKIVYHLQLLILCNLSVLVCPWQFFTSLSDITLSHSPKDIEHIHSEYLYGDCKRKDKKFYTHVHLDHMDVLGKVIIRGWIDIMRIPTCIILRAYSHTEDTFRSTSYPFQICVPRITYCHSQKRYKYHYYEWYIPNELYIGGMNWDLYFYGPSNVQWQ